MITFREKFGNEDTRMYKLRKLRFYKEQLADVECALAQTDSDIQRCRAEIEATEAAKAKLVVQREVMQRNAVMQAVAALVSFVAIAVYVIWRTW